jgi:hypothetical protein
MVTINKYINNTKQYDMIRINDLPRQVRLDLIEEARWQNGSEYVNDCVRDNVFIAEVCNWARTRQGYDYWQWIDKGLFVQMN